MPLADEIRSRGGLAATHELLAAGFSQRSLGYAAATGRIIRVRQGWYCLPRTDPALQEAVRVGGRLSCISGAEHHSLWVKRSGKLHVDVVSTASRLRSRTDKRVRLATLASPMTVIHWSDAASAGTRFALSARECLKRMIRCRPPEEVVAAADSALRLEVMSRARWTEDIRGVPPRLRTLLDRVDKRSESIIESIARFRLHYAGLEPQVQVRIPGVGRVDLLLGTRLVIELDGWEYHADRERFEADRRRDARLSARGFRVLRFSYHQVMDSWFEVQAAVLGALARGDHLS
jgi:very-short-patch-repair endonuclease